MSCQIACYTLFLKCISLCYDFATLRNAYSEIQSIFLGMIFNLWIFLEKFLIKVVLVFWKMRQEKYKTCLKVFLKFLIQSALLSFNCTLYCTTQSSCMNQQTDLQVCVNLLESIRQISCNYLFLDHTSFTSPGTDSWHKLPHPLITLILGSTVQVSSDSDTFRLWG